jgi:hypothetical protein
VTSDDCADHIEDDNKYRHIDDLELLELIMMSGILVDYDVMSHVPSDIGTHQRFLPPETFQTQQHLDSIATWTDLNLMKLNSAKSNYMIFSRSQEEFATRLTINGQTIKKKFCAKYSVFGFLKMLEIGKETQKKSANLLTQECQCLQN